MNPARWQQVKQVLESVLEREPPARAAFLASACRDDAALQSDVESLVAAYEKDPSFIESPAAGELLGLVRPSSSPPSELAAHHAIGPYQITRLIDSGGMGAVYEAVRADDAYRKKVAIKIIRQDSLADPRQRDELLRRFRAERQTLADLEHPNIARLLDGGTTPDGAPYLVMEFIEGRPIDTYCDENRLPIAQRLQLFRAACAAVQHAHRKLVVHRDLKPGNILVDETGTPKLLDFGIAKLLDPDSSALAGLITRTSARPMTPAYASPEQIRGQSVTTATDVYSLGVVLYELLTGHRPYKLNGQGVHDLPRLICEEEPVRPSVVVTQPWPTQDHKYLTPDQISGTREGRPERLRRRLAGDLDTIVLTALRKEPDRRYASVEQFSEDIRRHLQGEPVTARPLTATYRAGKFIRRHKVGVAAAGLVVLSLAGGVVATARQARIAEAEKRVAQRHAREADRSFEMFKKVFEPAVGPRGDPAGSRRREQDKINVVDFFQRGKSVISECRDEPLLQAKLEDTLGGLYGQLGHYEDALPLLKSALVTRRRELGTENGATVVSMNHLAAVLMDLEQWDDAQALLREAIPISGRVKDLEPAQRIWPEHNLGRLLGRMGKPSEAEPFLRKALQDFTAAVGESELDTLHAMNNLGCCLLDQRRYAEAAAILSRTVELRRKNAKLGPDHVETLLSVDNLAAALFRLGRQAEALQHFRAVYEGIRRVSGDKDNQTLEAANNYAYALMKTNHWEEAAPICKFVVDMALTQYPRGHANVARFRGNYGDCLTHVGRCEEAREHLMAAYQVILKKFGPTHPDTQKTIQKLVTHYETCGNAAKADEYRNQLIPTTQPGETRG